MPLTYRIDAVQRIVTITGDYAEPAEWRELLGRQRVRQSAETSPYGLDWSRTG